MIKPSKQSKELAGAIDEDQRRQAVDAAKKRAVAQQADYDTFKKLVSVAHLKPLHAPSTRSSGALLPAWQLDPNNLASSKAPAVNSSKLAASQSRPIDSGCSTSRSSAPPPAGEAAAAAAAGDEPVHLPCNSAEFSREWRRTCTTPAAKYRFLKQCGADSMGRIFKVEITGELLGQLLCVLREEWMKQAQQQQQQQQQNISQQQNAVSQQQQQQQVVEHCRPITDGADNSDDGCPEQSNSSSSSRAGPVTLQQEAQYVVQLLYQLTAAGRFDLNARLIGSKAKLAAAQLCDELATTLQAQQQQQDSSSSSSDRDTATAVALSGADERAVSAGAARAAVAAAVTAPAIASSSELKHVLQLDGESRKSGSSSSNIASRTLKQQQQQQQQQAVLTKLQHVRCKLHLIEG